MSVVGGAGDLCCVSNVGRDAFAKSVPWVQQRRESHRLNNPSIASSEAPSAFCSRLERTVIPVAAITRTDAAKSDQPRRAGKSLTTIVPNDSVTKILYLCAL